MNTLCLSSSVHLHFPHIACCWKFFLLDYTEVLCQYRRYRADHAYLTYRMLQRQPLIFSMSGFTLSYTANMFILIALILTNCPAYNISERITQETTFLCCSALVACQPSERTARKTRILFYRSLVHVRNLLPSSCRCLQSHYLETGLHYYYYCHVYRVRVAKITGSSSDD
jgi:hypothetical protein